MYGENGQFWSDEVALPPERRLLSATLWAMVRVEGAGIEPAWEGELR